MELYIIDWVNNKVCNSFNLVLSLGYFMIFFSYVFIYVCFEEMLLIYIGDWCFKLRWVNYVVY